MEKLTFNNFFRHYIVIPDSQDLCKKDQKQALIWSIAFGIFTFGISHLICGVYHMLFAKQVTKKPLDSKAAKVMQKVHKITNPENPGISYKPNSVKLNTSNSTQPQKAHSGNPKLLQLGAAHPDNSAIQTKISNSNKSKPAEHKVVELDNPRTVKPAVIESEKPSSSFSFLDLPEECRLRVLNLAANPKFAVSSRLSDNKHYAADPKFRLINKEMRNLWDQNLKLINHRLIFRAGFKTIEIDGKAVEIPWLLCHLPEGQTEIERFKSISTLLHKRARMMEVDTKTSRHMSEKNRFSYELTLAARIVNRMRREDMKVAKELEQASAYILGQERLEAREALQLQRVLAESLKDFASQNVSEFP